MKINIVGGSIWTNRMYESCGSFQWARELLQNALEARARRVEFQLEWEAVEALGVYRRAIFDDGTGMSSQDLIRFFSTLGAGSKKIESVHDNFGIGAKIALLPWNPLGLVVISYQNEKGSMIWVRKDTDSGEYELREFDFPEGKTVVIDPEDIDWKESGDVDWSQVAPQWIRKQGTAIVLLGGENNPDTIQGDPRADEADIKGLSSYLNSRFWCLDDAEVYNFELRSNKKSSWPEQRCTTIAEQSRLNKRQLRGAKYYLLEVKGKGNKTAHREHGTLVLQEGRLRVSWFLWHNSRPEIHMYAKKNGYIAVKYNNELFEMTDKKVDWRQFGIIESAIQERLTLVIEPKQHEAGGAEWGISPDQSRTRLTFCGEGQRGGNIPLAQWGNLFAEKMPNEIFSAIKKARHGDTQPEMSDEYRKRLQDRFGSRFTMKVPVSSASGGSISNFAEGQRNQGRDKKNAKKKNEGQTATKKPRTEVATSKKSDKVYRKSSSQAKIDASKAKNISADLPKYEFAESSEFLKEFHLALWAPKRMGGPTVLVNSDAPALQEMISFHQSRVLPQYAEQVASVVRNAIGEIASCKIAHTQNLTRFMSEQEVDQVYRSEEALTISLMGLMAEEAVISQRLGKFGPKRDGRLEPSGNKPLAPESPSFGVNKSS